MRKTHGNLLLALMWITCSGCAAGPTQYGAVPYGSSGPYYGYNDYDADTRDIISWSRCGRGHRADLEGVCYYVGFTATPATSDADLQRYWRRRVAEVCKAPVPVPSEGEPSQAWWQTLRIFDFMKLTETQEPTIEDVQFQMSGPVQPPILDPKQPPPPQVIATRTIDAKRIQAYVLCPTK